VPTVGEEAVMGLEELRRACGLNCGLTAGEAIQFQIQISTFEISTD